MQTTHAEALYRVSQGLASSLDLNHLAQLALVEALEVAALDAGVIRYVDQPAGELVFLASHGLSAQLDAEMRAVVGRVELGRGLAGEVARTGKPPLVEELGTDERCLLPDLAKFGFHSAAYLPLRAGNETVGVISGYSMRRRVFSPEDLEVLGALGVMVGVAIANARLFRQIEQAKREWERTFDSMGEGVAIVDTGHRILRGNRALAGMLGMSVQDLIGRHTHDLVHGLDGPPPDCPICVCLLTKQPCEAIWREPHLGGRWLRLRGDPILSPEGELVGVVHSFADISREKGREVALERLHDLSMMLSSTLNLHDALRFALEKVSHVFSATGSTLGIALLDESARALKVEAVLGPLQNRLEGRSLPIDQLAPEGIRILFQEHRPWLQADLSQSSQALKDLPGFLEHKCFLAVPMVSAGRAIGVLFLAHKESGLPGVEEMALLETFASEVAIAVQNVQRSTIGSIIASMSEGLVVADLRGRIILFNQAAEKLLDLSTSDFIGGTVDALQEALARRIVDIGPFQSAWRADLSRLDETLTLEFEVSVGLVKRNVQTTLFRIGDRAGRLGTGILFRDVTREREADRMKTEFISIASHELRTPLTGILGFAELLLMRCKDLAENERRWLETIHRESKRLNSIVEDLLDVSHIEAGRLSLNLEPVGVRPLAETIVEQLRPSHPSHDLRVEIPGDIPDVLGDRNKVHQVLFNLVDNAVMYSPGGGPVVVRASRSADNRSVVVAVSDRGLGIPEEELPKLFTRFHRVERRGGAKMVRGTGLGLYIARSLVELMRGQVSVQSKVDEGSTFSFSLPAYRTQLVFLEVQ